MMKIGKLAVTLGVTGALLFGVAAPNISMAAAPNTSTAANQVAGGGGVSTGGVTKFVHYSTFEWRQYLSHADTQKAVSNYRNAASVFGIGGWVGGIFALAFASESKSIAGYDRGKGVIVRIGPGYIIGYQSQ